MSNQVPSRGRHAALQSYRVELKWAMLGLVPIVESGFNRTGWN